jgi:hypothetical protein
MEQEDCHPSEIVAAYKAAYDTLAQSKYRGIHGIYEARAAKDGPTAAILACTHGNEPAGLGVIDYLLSDLQLAKGRILFILVNMDAATQYLSATHDLEREKARYIHHNMNRLPKNSQDWAGSAEGKRLSDLLPILAEVDGGVLDLHSTSANAPAMLITDDHTALEFARCPSMPFETIIHGIHRFLQGSFIIHACQHAPLRLLAECGQHQCPQASSRAIEISLCFLAKLGIIPSPHLIENTEKTPDIYHVNAAVRLPAGDRSYRLVRAIEPFAWLEKGTPIASNGTQILRAPSPGYAIMCPKTDAYLCPNEALLFLCDKTSG